MGAVTVITLTPEELDQRIERAVAKALGAKAPAPAAPTGYLTIQAAADELDCSTDTIYRWIQSGRLRASRVGGGRGPWRIARADLEAALADSPAPPVDPDLAAVRILARRR